MQRTDVSGRPIEVPGKTIPGIAADGKARLTELPEDRTKMVEAGVAAFQRAQHELETTRKERDEAKLEVTRLKVALEAMDAQQNQLESRIQTAMIQRDEAVAVRAALEHFFVSIQAQFRVFNLPAAPLIAPVLDPDATA